VRETTGGGLRDERMFSLFQDDRARIWVSGARGVMCLENGRFTPVSAVPGQHVVSMTGDGTGGLWISQRQNLVHRAAEGVVEQIPWASLGHKDFAQSLLSDPLQGGLWLGFGRRGVAYLNEGHVLRSYAAADGLGEGVSTTFDSIGMARSGPQPRRAEPAEKRTGDHVDQ
jgi:ligand-binding sensor domain-containing protein